MSELVLLNESRSDASGTAGVVVRHRRCRRRAHRFAILPAISGHATSRSGLGRGFQGGLPPQPQGRDRGRDSESPLLAFGMTPSQYREHKALTGPTDNLRDHMTD